MKPPRQVITRSVVPCLEEFVESFVRPSRPLLVRNAFARWCPRWTVDELRQRLVDVAAASNNKPNEQGRLLIPSPAGANYVARCTPNHATVDELLRLRKEEDEDDASTAAPSNNNQQEQEQQQGQLLVPSPGVNYVSQYRSEEIELPTDQALEEFIRMSRNDMHGCQCRLDPAVFWEPVDELPSMLRDDRFQIVYDNSFVWITSKSIRTSLHVSRII